MIGRWEPSSDLSFFTTSRLTPHCIWVAAGLSPRQGFPLNIDYELSEDSTIVSMVMQGLGAAILPRLAAEPIPAEVKVYSFPVDFERVIGVAVLRDALLVPAVFAFLDVVKGAAEVGSEGEFPINPS